MRTHLYLDIDGVLNAYASLHSEPRYRAWPDYRNTQPNGLGEVVSRLMIGDLNGLIARHGITPFWLTTWERQAPAWGESIGLVGSGQWPWLPTRDVPGMWGKHHSIRTHVATTAPDRVIWIDDDLRDEHRAASWAAESGHLALAPFGAHGITPAMMRQIHDYLSEPLPWGRGIRPENMPANIPARYQPATIPAHMPVLLGPDAVTLRGLNA